MSVGMEGIKYSQKQGIRYSQQVKNYKIHVKVSWFKKELISFW